MVLPALPERAAPSPPPVVHVDDDGGQGGGGGGKLLRGQLDLDLAQATETGAVAPKQEGHRVVVQDVVCSQQYRRPKEVRLAGQGDRELDFGGRRAVPGWGEGGR